MKKVLLFVFALALVLSPAIVHAAGNTNSASTNTNSAVNPNTFKMINMGVTRIFGINELHAHIYRYYDPQTKTMCYLAADGGGSIQTLSCVQLTPQKK